MFNLYYLLFVCIFSKKVSTLNFDAYICILKLLNEICEPCINGKLSITTKLPLCMLVLKFYIKHNS